MTDIQRLEKILQEKCEEISQEIEGNPPVVIIAAGTTEGPNRTVTASTGTHRMRDLLGILEASKQIESLNHILPQILKQLQERKGED